MAIKSNFNIPIKVNDTTQWHTIQFQSQISDVTNLSNKLDLYLTDGDTKYFTKEKKLHPSLFPDAVLGQLIQVGFIENPIAYKNPATDYYEVRVLLTNTGKTLLQHKFPNIFDYTDFYLTGGSAKDGPGTSYEVDGTLYMGYADLPGVYFLTRIITNDCPDGVVRNGFLGKDWYPDDWCVPTASGFGQITNHDAVTSVNGQIGHVYTYGGSISECDYFHKGTFYQFDQNQWYPQYSENTTSNEIPAPREFIAICIQSGSKDSIKWDTVTTPSSNRQQLTKGNVEQFFITSAGRDYNTNTEIYLPYSQKNSTVVADILNDFGSWILDNKKYYDNALTVKGHTQSNPLYKNDSGEKTTIMGGLAKGTYVMLASQQSDPEWDNQLGMVEDYNFTVPDAKTTNSTINDYKFYIQFNEKLKGSDLI